MADEKQVIIRVSGDTAQIESSLDNVKSKLEGAAASGQRSFTSYKAAIREATVEAAQLERQFGKNSNEFRVAAQRVAELKDQFSEFNNTVQAFNPDNKFQSFIGVARGAANAVQGVAGAMTVLGADSETAQVAIARLQGLMAFTDALGSVNDIKESFGDFKSVISSSIQPLIEYVTTNRTLSTVNGQVAVSTTAASTATKVFRTALISTGIGAIIVALGLLVANLDKVGEALGFTTQAQKDYNETLEDYKKEATNSITKINEVKTAFDLAKSGVISKDEALKKYNDSLGDAFGKTNSLGEAERLLNSKADAYIRITALKAQANALFAKSAEKTADSLLASSQDQTGFLGKAGAALRGLFGGQGAVVKSLIESQKEGVKDATESLSNDAKKLEDKGKELLTQASELAKNSGINVDIVGNKDDKKEEKKNDTILDDRKKLQKELDDYLDENSTKTLESELDKIRNWYNEKYKIAKGDADLLLELQRVRADRELALRIEYARKEKQALQNEAPPETVDNQALIDKVNQESKIRIDGARLTSAGLAEAARQDVETFAEATKTKLELYQKDEEGRIQLGGNVIETAQNVGAIFGKEAVVQKGISVAQTTISTIQSAQDAYKAMSGIPIVGPALGAIAFAASLKRGYDAVKQIVGVKIPGAADRASGSLPSISAPVINSTQLNNQGPQDVRVVNQNTRPSRAYIVQRDLDENNERQDFLNKLGSI